MPVTPREEEPQINVTMANVLIAFPGASSTDAPNLVSRPGVAVLTVQIQAGVPRSEALVRLHDVLNADQHWLPKGLGALPPVVKPKGIDDVPVPAVTLWSRADRAAGELEAEAQKVEAGLGRVPGAREVQTIGGPGRVVQVTLEPARLREIVPVAVDAVDAVGGPAILATLTVIAALLLGVVVAVMLSLGLAGVQWVVLKMLPFDNKLVRVERGIIDAPLCTKDLQGVSHVFADADVGAGGKTPDSPLYGLFGIRGKLADAALPGTGELGEYWIRQPADPDRAYTLKWDGESQITYETVRDMGAACGVGLILIHLLVVAQFKNDLTPLVIMAPIPLTIIGVMPGHALLAAPFTATSMIGIIALAGSIVRNSILLTGLAAMIVAFFILDAPIFNGVAISLIFGIAVSTLLTLVVIPVLHFAVNRRHHPEGVSP